MVVSGMGKEDSSDLVFIPLTVIPLTGPMLDGLLALAQHASKDSPSPGGEGWGEGGRGNKSKVASLEQLELFKAAQKFGG